MATDDGLPEPFDPERRYEFAKEYDEGEFDPIAPSLLCVQCKGEVKDPHLLGCLHCVCKECLERVEEQNGRLKCPQCGDTSTCSPQAQHMYHSRTCRSYTAATEVQCVPVRCMALAQHIEGRQLLQKVASGETVLCSNSVCDNPTSLAIVLCLNCKEFLCQSCNSAHQLMCKKISEEHAVQSVSELRSLPPSVQLTSLVPQLSVTPTTCPYHEGEPLKYCCEDCDTLLCQACTVSKDLGHQPKYLNKAALAQHTQCLVAAKEAVVHGREVYRKAAAILESQRIAVDKATEKAHCETKQIFQRLHDLLSEKEADLHIQIATASDQKRHSLTARTQSCNEVDESLAVAQSTLSFLLTSGSSHEVVANKKLAHMKQSVVTSQCRGGAGATLVSSVVKFLPQQEETLLVAIKEFGLIQDGASPLHCTVDPKPEAVRQYPPVAFILTTVDRSNIPCSSGGERVQAFLCPRPPLPGPAIKAKVVDKENGQYEVVFHAVYSGECELSFLVNGKHISGSPFSVLPLAAVLHNGRWITTRDVQCLSETKGSLQFPRRLGVLYGIAVSPVNGSIFASDCDNSVIHVFDAERRHVRTFGQHGKGSTQLNYPSGVDVSAQGHLYVANLNNNCVSVFGDDGTVIRTIGQGKLQNPCNVLVHNGCVYVADTSNHRIPVFSQEGELLYSFGSWGKGKGELKNPSGLAVSPDGHHLYVSDQNNRRVQVFTLKGQYVREFGNGHLKYPRSLTVTSNGSVLVADYANNRVAVFDKNGGLTHSLTVHEPTNLVVNSKGDLLIVSYKKKCVLYF